MKRNKLKRPFDIISGEQVIEQEADGIGSVANESAIRLDELGRIALALRTLLSNGYGNVEVNNRLIDHLNRRANELSSATGVCIGASISHINHVVGQMLRIAGIGNVVRAYGDNHEVSVTVDFCYHLLMKGILSSSAACVRLCTGYHDCYGSIAQSTGYPSNPMRYALVMEFDDGQMQVFLDHFAEGSVIGISKVF